MYQSPHCSFNRYMVECESLIGMSGLLCSLSFNRYMVECECTCQILIYSDMRIVLIDTWWNVNLRRKSKCPELVCVLIDTWWNVNVLPNFSYANHGKVLIDTWWNVNTFTVSVSPDKIKF